VSNHYQIEQSSTKPKPTEYIQQTRQRYDSLGYPPYQWFQAEDLPELAPLSKPLSESKLGLLSSAGTYVSGQTAFFYKDDASIRQIPSGTGASDLRFSHIMENYLVEAWQDPGVLFPIEQLRGMVADGLIGSLADNFISCMGGIYSQRKVRDELIPEVEAAVDEQNLDVLLLVPL
jgi:D-proline reductase (dithiol) PrdB